MTDVQKSAGTARARRRRVVAAVVLVAAMGSAFVFRGPLFRGNFGVVDPGRVYRSAQPWRNFEGLIDERGLGSVLNLRGGSPRDPWYVHELRACRTGRVDFYDLPMSATTRPSRQDLLQMIDLFGRCRYPLLIHCKSGSDRTGLASALYLMVARGLPPEKATSEFSVGYGHVPLLGTQRLHEPFHEYEGWLEARSLSHSPEVFRDWVEREYDDPAPGGAATALRPGPRVPLFGRVIFPDDPVSR